MNPIQIAQLILQFLPYGRDFAVAMVTLLHKPVPTVDDWKAALSLAQTPFAQGLHEGVLQPDK